MIDIAGLSREERVELMSRIWQSLAVEPEALDLSAEQKRTLERRVAKLETEGSTGILAAEMFAKRRASRA